MIQGIITGFLLVAFVGGWIWLYGKARQPALDAAARMPLEDEPVPAANASFKQAEDRP
ncbi:MAG: cbb3-type cytochrome c oxidase subunit 3 [Xanthomonadales bacterium]|nr:cbb3-type cytochrome c oxidase subunit 3 [Xanthomonadales bacterium]